MVYKTRGFDCGGWLYFGAAAKEPLTPCANRNLFGRIIPCKGVFRQFCTGTFGKPRLEVMAQPLNDDRARPELCGDTSAYCNPDDLIDIANAIRRLVNEHWARVGLAVRATAVSYFWNSTAACTTATIDQYHIKRYQKNVRAAMPGQRSA